MKLHYDFRSVVKTEEGKVHNRHQHSQDGKGQKANSNHEKNSKGYLQRKGDPEK